MIKIRGLQGTKDVDGGLCAPKEFRMASNEDIAILYCEWECVSAYISTENIFKSEMVKLCLRRPQHFKSHAVVLSNLSSDAMGWDDAKIVYDRMQTIAKGLQMDYRRAYAVSLADLKTAPRGFDEEEIYAMTKDLRWRVADNAMNLTGVKQYTLALQFFIGNDYPCVMAGTMFWGAEGDNRKRIIVLTTDVLIQEELMRRALEKEYRESVMLLGGEQGVNDCACILSNGRVKNMKIEVADSEYSKFVRALRHVMTELCRRYGNAEADTSADSHLNSCMRQALGCISSESHRDISLGEIADFVGLSKYYFAREFKKVTGYTFVSYLNVVRCEKAKLLLTETTRSIGDVSAECGFSDQSYFTRVFKKHVGVLPAEFRRSVSS